MRRPSTSSGSRGEGRTAFLFLLPLVAVIVLFIVIPVLGTFWTGLFRDVTYLPGKFVYLSNYKRLLADADFWRSFRFTMLFVATAIPLEMLLGMVFALILNERLKLRNALRATVLIPWAVPTIVAARTWELIYNYGYGLANYLVALFGISDTPVNWLGSPISAFFALVLADVWKTTPFVAIILLAGLQTIPEEIYEQARVDGTDFLQRFFKLTLPMLKPVIAVALIFRTIDTIRILDLIYVVTDGGPGGSTTSLSLYGYKYFNEGDFGYGSAVAVVVFVIAFLLSISYLRVGGFGRAME
ncbi:carbohydrate ABC transporter permease [Candidatus Eisenbacteria bacterium]|uniref:Carbohydrate ABC transporter permease n=1 Tax=Eiseniibacteriota bacterium TaxID=2212470 RepID=A0ABV6YND1_UNCEI